MKGIIPLMHVLKTSKCEHCIMQKSKKLPFKVMKHTSKPVMGYAHRTLWGPSQPVTMSVMRYFMSIDDDYSRKILVYILKEKSQTFKKFKEWIKK